MKALYGDRDLLFQAYANILDNAVKFTPENGHVSIRMYQKDTKLHTEILDTGIGIQGDEQDSIFNRFYRSEKSRGSTGTGLGLSLVNAVIELHGGKIKVENASPGFKIITVL